MAKVSLRSYNREIETMLDGGLFSEAVAHSLHILKTHPKHLETYRLLGKAYLELKQYSDASDIFSRLLACVPNDFVAHVGMGIIRDEENKTDDAIWHMERAFETQPSNPAIQSELQRLYARRDGSAPPRIRMTRGALAQMYLQGELYPQAISEIKGVLKEDPGRTDMQALLARAYFRSGQKNEAAEAASSLLRRYPYCLDANSVLAEILGTDRPDSADSYRQRVLELDPYAAHAASIFHSAEAPESAVALEKLDWNGQPVNMPSDWRETEGIGLPRGEVKEEQPAWLRGGFRDRETVPPTPLVGPVSDLASSLSRAEDDIPDFMRKAGWQESTGTFDESKSTFAVDDTAQPPAIAAGVLPDWVKDLAPPEALTPAAEKEDLPDWMNRIDPGILGGMAGASSMSGDQPNDLTGMDKLFAAEPGLPAGDLPDWLSENRGADQPVQPAFTSEEMPDLFKDLDQPVAADLPNWLSEAGSADQPAQPAFTSEEMPDLLKDLDQPVAADPGLPAGDLPDWLSEARSADQPVQPAFTSEEMPDLLKGLDRPVSADPGLPVSDLPDWLNEARSADQPVQSAFTSEEMPDLLKDLDRPVSADLGLPAGDLPDWLSESRGADQPAQPAFTSEEMPDLLKDLEQPLSAEPGFPAGDLPDWLSESRGADQPPQPAFTSEEMPDVFKGLDQPVSAEPSLPAGDLPDWLNEGRVADQPPQPAFTAEEMPDLLKDLDQPVAADAGLPAGDLPDWLSEGSGPDQPSQPIFTSGDQPDWLTSKDAEPGKPTSEPVSFSAEPQPEPPSLGMPTAMAETPATSEKDLDDSFAWLESLAAKQGATEGLLMKPEDRLEQEPEWVRQAKSLGGEVEQPMVDSTPAMTTPPVAEPQAQPPGDLESLGKTEQEQDDSFAWLENLAARQGAREGLLTKPEDRMQQEPDWVKQAKEIGEEVAPAMDDVPVPADDTAGWLRSLDHEETKPEPAPESVEDDTDMWLRSLGDADALPAPAFGSADETSTWLRGLDEKEASVEPAGNDTSMWLKSLEDADAKPEPLSGSADDTSMWLKSLDQPEPEPAAPAPASDLPEWMQSLEPEKSESEAEPALPEVEAEETSGWTSSVDQPLPRVDTGGLPSWLRGVDQDEAESVAQDDDLPAWLRDDTGEAVSEPVTIEPTRPDEWRPVEAEDTFIPPAAMEPAETPVLEIPAEDAPKPAPKRRPDAASEGKKPAPAARKAEPASGTYREPVTRRAGGMLSPEEDPVLVSARNELSRSNIPGALDTYSKLIKRGRFLDEVIFDLREALYRYPVEVSIWQSLGDAYMRANRLQDALDSYTKAEELLR